MRRQRVATVNPSIKVPGLALAGLLIAAGVASCSDPQQPLTYTKGSYGGQADEKLSVDQVSTLRQRGTLQAY